MEKQKSTELIKLRSYAAKEAQEVEKAMRQDLAEALSGDDPLLIEVLEYALFSGGKRIRPLLVILASRCCGASEESLYRLAIAFEYLHVATLIHDDVIDHAKERRGQQSLINRYGLAAAILSGDWLHARSMDLIGQLTGPEGLKVFSRATTAMVDGEFLQLRFAADSSVTEAQYFSVIHKKTAGLISTACEIGAMFGQAEEEERLALRSFGYNLGNSFQVIDDLLDYQGDSRNTGKKIGNDFVEGKLTLPLIRALAGGSQGDKQKIIELLGGDRANPDNFLAVKELISKNNGFESALGTATELINKAINTLNIFTDEEVQESREMLATLALYVSSRNK